jgi:hypothetical protein
MLTRGKLALALITLALIVLAGCQVVGEATPTSFLAGAATIAPPPATPIAVELLRLVMSPAQYENNYVRVSGRYRRLPVVACEGAPRRAPASWALAADELSIQAGGYDTLLAAVAPNELMLEVEGQWRRWRGPVGCGKQAAQTEIWFLDVTRILSPNPIAYQTAPPGATVIAQITPTPESGGPPPAGTPVAVGTAPPTASAALSPTPPLVSTAPSATATRPPAGVGTPTATSGASTAAPTTTMAATPGQGTSVASPSPTPTLSSTPGAAGSQTPTATTAAGTAPATTTSVPTVPSGTVQDMGPIDYEDIVKEVMPAGASHRWLFDGNSGETVFIRAIAATGANATLTLRDPQGNALIAEQNSAAAEQPEVIQNYALPMSGEYAIIVGNSAGNTTSYAMTIYDANSYPLIFVGNVRYGDLVNGSLAADSDQYWFFSGTAGETITIRVTPSDSSDPFISLIAPDLASLVDFIDDNGSGQAEELLNFQLPATGYYSILVAEGFFAASNYSLNLTRQ